MISEVWRSWWSFIAILRMRLTSKAFFLIKRQCRIVSLRFPQWCSWGSCYFGIWRSQWPRLFHRSLKLCKHGYLENVDIWLRIDADLYPRMTESSVLNYFKISADKNNIYFRYFQKISSLHLVSVFSHRTNFTGINEAQTILSSLIYNIQPTKCTTNYSIIWLFYEENILCMYSLMINLYKIRNI